MKLWLALSLMLVSALPLRAQDDEDYDPDVLMEPSCFNDRIRVSALISTGDKVKVGLVETLTNASYLLSPGEFAGEIEVLAADYENETVTLRLGSETCTLNLSSDPSAAEYVETTSPEDEVYRGEAIEQFLRENPDALLEGRVKFPLPVEPEAQGKGEGIESFLRDHPDIAAKVDQPAVGRGEGIESYLKAHPEIQLPDDPPDMKSEPESDSDENFDEVTENPDEPEEPSEE